MIVSFSVATVLRSCNIFLLFRVSPMCLRMAEGRWRPLQLLLVARRVVVNYAELAVVWQRVTSAKCCSDPSPNGRVPLRGVTNL